MGRFGQVPRSNVNFLPFLCSTTRPLKMAFPRAPVDFSYLQNSLESDQEIREKIKEAVRVIEQEENKCLAVLNRVHSVGREDSG